MEYFCKEFSRQPLRLPLSLSLYMLLNRTTFVIHPALQSEACSAGLLETTTAFRKHAAGSSHILERTYQFRPLLRCHCTIQSNSSAGSSSTLQHIGCTQHIQHHKTQQCLPKGPAGTSIAKFSAATPPWSSQPVQLRQCKIHTPQGGVDATEQRA